jgi:signal transduction histidine kinase
MIDFEEVKKYTKDLDILYVEDDKVLREETTDILEGFFNSITVAIDGQDGLNTYLKYKELSNKYFDLIITDINMPNKCGILFSKDVLNINNEQSIIVISADNESDKLIELIQTGISNFILKPISLKPLLLILYNTCKNIYLKKSREKFLIQQSKMAFMGEMIDSIAHQWKQPLGVIKLTSQSVCLLQKTNKLTEKVLDRDLDRIDSQVTHLLSTLDSFRNFLRPIDSKKVFNIKSIIDDSLVLLSDVIYIHKIKIDIIGDFSLKTKLFKNEFIHVLINLINNSKDAFVKNLFDDEDNRQIIFNIFKENEEINLTIKDNAGGISPKIIDNIFNQNFTTKSEENGTGIGLFMTKMIVEKINAFINVYNEDDGVVFKIVF